MNKIMIIAYIFTTMSLISEIMIKKICIIFTENGSSFSLCTVTRVILPKLMFES